MDALHKEYARRLKEHGYFNVAVYTWLCAEMVRADKEGRNWREDPWPPYDEYEEEAMDEGQ